MSETSWRIRRDQELLFLFVHCFVTLLIMPMIWSVCLLFDDFSRLMISPSISLQCRAIVCVSIDVSINLIS